MPDLFLHGIGGGMDLITPREVVIYLLLSFILGQAVAWVYVWTHRELSYSRSMVQALILLSMIVTTVMLAVGNNIATAFGLFGALALVRFRTPVKDTRDTAFLFMAVGIGIMSGSRNLTLAICGTAVLAGVALFLFWTRFGERATSDGTLRFTMPALAEQEGRLSKILAHYCSHFALVHMRETSRENELEFAYRVRLVDPLQSPGM
ncbi:MAG: DUF4956 domain-containing protein, partial [Planctomycetes bacterium]|nr:DUF4956 domain-containing protein [Planctomycetota bacterium]